MKRFSFAFAALLVALLALWACSGSSPAPSGDGAAELDFSSGTFSWDGDGDGKPEAYDVTFHDNGDEAPSLYEIRCIDDERFTVLLEGAYDLEKIEANADESGPYLVLSYHEGDFYSHDKDAAATLRIIDGAFALEAL